MPVEFRGVKAKTYGAIMTLSISLDTEYTKYDFINTQSILEIVCEIGGFAILLWYFMKYLSSFVHPFYL